MAAAVAVRLRSGRVPRAGSARCSACPARLAARRHSRPVRRRVRRRRHLGVAGLSPDPSRGGQVAAGARQRPDRPSARGLGGPPGGRARRSAGGSAVAPAPGTHGGDGRWAQGSPPATRHRPLRSLGVAGRRAADAHRRARRRASGRRSAPPTRSRSRLRRRPAGAARRTLDHSAGLYRGGAPVLHDRRPARRDGRRIRRPDSARQYGAGSRPGGRPRPGLGHRLRRHPVRVARRRRRRQAGLARRNDDRPGRSHPRACRPARARDVADRGRSRPSADRGVRRDPRRRGQWPAVPRIRGSGRLRRPRGRRRHRAGGRPCDESTAAT